MRLTEVSRRAPRFLGAFLLAVTGLLSSCERGQPIPEWEGKTAAQELAEPPVETEAPVPTRTETASLTTGGLKFVAYNVQNWLTMDRRGRETTKPESERDAAVRIIAGARPDLLGICEIGTEEDLADLQARLQSAGIDLPHTHHAGGGDDTRHLAFLSRLPFSAVKEHHDLGYKLDGREMVMGRGILDVTVAAPGADLRFLGVHLKSKREVPEADQEMMRRSEAHILRRQVDEILKADPETRLIVYGDLNDSRNASATRIVRGPRDPGMQLNMAFLRDSRGDTWTHHWGYQDIYSRFDYILVSDALTRSVDWDACGVLDPPTWADASDHRALLLVLE